MDSAMSDRLQLMMRPESVAKALGVSGVYPELLPEQKLQKVAELIDAGRKVAMLGRHQ